MSGRLESTEKYWYNAWISQKCNCSAVYLPSSAECAGGKPRMSSLCQDICQIAFTSKLVTLFIIYPGARLNCCRK